MDTAALANQAHKSQALLIAHNKIHEIWILLHFANQAHKFQALLIARNKLHEIWILLPLSSIRK